MNETNDIEPLWKSANDYVVLAMQSLMPTRPTDSGSDQGEREVAQEGLETELRINFLFPNLGNEDRLLLKSLHHAGQAIRIGYRRLEAATEDQLTREEKSSIERNTVRQEEMFTEIREEVQEVLVPLLTPLQAQIIKLKFLKVF